MQDEDGEGIRGFRIEDIEITADHFDDWHSLAELDEGLEDVSVTEFTDHGDGTYTYRIERPAGEVVLSYRVDGIVIETDLVTEIAGEN